MARADATSQVVLTFWRIYTIGLLGEREMIRFFFVGALAILSGNLVFAEEILIEPALRTIPDRRAIAPKSIATIDDDLPLDVDRLAAHLKSQFEYYAALSTQNAPPCSGEKADDYALALQVKGRFDDCVQYARACATEKNVASPRVMARGAACLAVRYQFDEADRLYKAATDSHFADSPDYADVVYDYASFSMYGIQARRVPEILALKWSSDDATMWKR